DYLMPITQLGGIHQNLPQLPSFTSFSNVKDYDDYLARMRQVPGAVDQTIEVLKLGISRGVTPPQITLRAVGDQIQAVAATHPEDSAFYDPFKNIASAVSSSEQTRLRQEAAKIIS